MAVGTGLCVLVSLISRGLEKEMERVSGRFQGKPLPEFGTSLEGLLIMWFYYSLLRMIGPCRSSSFSRRSLFPTCS